MWQYTGMQILCILLFNIKNLFHKINFCFFGKNENIFMVKNQIYGTYTCSYYVV